MTVTKVFLSVILGYVTVVSKRQLHHVMQEWKSKHFDKMI